jgi:starch synthase (maltosyl-transferring)
VGESIPIRAQVFREGHDAVNASVVLTDPGGQVRIEPMHRTTPAGFDWWTASVVLETEGNWTFRVEGWSDPWETWVHNAEIKIPAGIDVALVCTEGKSLFSAAADRAQSAGAPQVAALLRGAAKSLDSGQQVEDRLEVVLADDVRAAMATYGPRELVSPTPDYPLYVDRRAALFASWYEFFPRSQGAEYDEETETWKSGTFDSSHERLEAAAAMGFDVVYIPPIHPIGYEFRKGPNNTLTRARAIPARRGRSAATRAGTTPSIPTWATSRRSTGSWPRPSPSAWRSRWTSPCRPRPTIRGSPSTRNGSPTGPTARSRTRRTRRRSTRTSTRSTSTTTGTASTPRACAS